MQGLVVLLLHPLTWTVITLGLIAWWTFERRNPPAYPEYRKGVHPPGTLIKAGNPTTSKAEMRVRSAIEAMGYKPHPQGTALVVHDQLKGGQRRLYTPDIILSRPKKVIVEYDPYNWHGTPKKILEDMKRNREFSKLGYAVVRVRINWPEGHPNRTLGPNDVVILEDDFYPQVHADRLYKAIRHAKRQTWGTWNRDIANLEAQVESAQYGTQQF